MGQAATGTAVTSEEVDALREALRLAAQAVLRDALDGPDAASGDGEEAVYAWAVGKLADVGLELDTEDRELLRWLAGREAEKVAGFVALILRNRTTPQDAMDELGTCATCGSTEWRPVLYGLSVPIDANLMAAVERGDVEFGGFSHRSDGPWWRCRRCGAASPWRA